MPDEYAIGACGFSQTLCDQPRVFIVEVLKVG